MKFYRFLFLLLVFAGASSVAFCQQDSLKVTHDTIIAKKKPASIYGDSAMIHGKMRKHNPQTASLRSAIIPGWGQVYNRSYWKVPIIYAALGITTYVFIDNLKTVKDCNYAIKYLTPTDSAGTSYDNIADYLHPLVNAGDVNSIRNYRNQYRQYVDYAALVFILFWGLNVVDATVDAHLKHFDVTDDLSMKIKPNFVPQVGGQTFGVSLVFDIHKGKSTSRGLP